MYDKLTWVNLLKSFTALVLSAYVVGYFAFKRNWFSAYITLLWVGQNFIDVSVYAADAVKMQLPLITGGNGWETGQHDWNTILIYLGWLHYTDTVALTLKIIGITIISIAAAGSLYFALRPKEEIFIENITSHD